MFKFIIIIFLSFFGIISNASKQKCDLDYIKCIEPISASGFNHNSLSDFERYLAKQLNKQSLLRSKKFVNVINDNGKYLVVFKEEKIELIEVCLQILKYCN